MRSVYEPSCMLNTFSFKGFQLIPYDQASNGRSDASWRSERLSLADFVERQIRRGKRVTPLLSIPGVSLNTFRRDWLHAVDQGVGADALGNLFKVFVSKMPGSSQKEKVAALWEEVDRWYHINHVKDKLVGLRWGGIQQKKSSPKLKGNAACVRALIPFADETAQKLLDTNDLVESAMLSLIRNLHECYKCLALDEPGWIDRFRSCSANFAEQYAGLESQAEKLDWKVKPKMHVFLEMSLDVSKPSLSWTYRDEDYGGSIAKLCRMRGRWHRVISYSRRVLDMFHMGNPVPRIL